MADETERRSKNAITEKDLQKIRENLEDIAFGSVSISVQDGRIVQIEKSEKFRIK
ncbi:MAG: YezD family protein [Acetatifactor sp.]